MSTNPSSNHLDSSADSSIPINALSQPVAVVDTAGVILTVNHDWLQFALEIGITDKGQALGMNYDVILKMTGARDSLRDSIWEHLNSGDDDGERSYQYDGELFGENRSFDITINGYKSNGERRYLITQEERAASTEVNQELELFEESLDHSTDAIYISDPRTAEFIHVNQSATSMLGYDQDTLEDMNVHDIAPEIKGDTYEWDELVERAKSEGSIEIRSKHLRKDGSMIPTEVHLDYLEIGNHPRMVSIVRDLSDRLEREDELEKTERRFRQMAENIDEVFWMRDVSDNELLYVSPALESIWGYSQEEFYENNGLWLETIIEEERSDVEEALESITENGFDVEYHIERPDGEIRCIHDEGFPVENSDGDLIRIVGSAKDITEECNVENELRDKAEYLEAVSDRFPGVTYQFKIDPEGHFSFPYMSEGHEQFSGVSSEEVMGDFESAIDNVHPEDRERLLASIKQIGREPGPWEEEYRYQHPEKGTKWVVASSLPQEQSDGSIIWYGVIFDITDRKRAQEDLRLKERAMASTTEGITIADARQDDNPIIYVNEGFENLTGYEAEEVLGKNCRFLQGPETSPDAVKTIREGIGKEESVTQEVLNHRKDGTTFWNQLSINPIYDDDDNLTHFVGIQKNITQRRQAKQSLAESEKRFRNLVEKLENVFWTTDPDFERFHYVSPLYEEWWGQPVGEIYNDKFAWASAVHPDDLDDLKSEIDRHIINADSPDEYRRMEQEFRMRTSEDDDWRWCYVTGSPITNEDGTVEKIVGIVSDISEQKQTQQALSESLEQKTILVQEVHHRVKNNLQVLLGLLSLQSRRVEGEYAKRALENSKRRVNSMALIHEKLYEKDNFSTVNVQDYISDLTENIIQTSADNKLNLSVNIDVDVDELKPETIIPCGLIINELVSNAVEHAFQDQKSGEITVEFNRRGGEYHLVVSDDGKGTPMDEMLGTDSLGLTLVENLSENQLHGQIDVQNGDGLSVHITFPVE